MKGWKRSVKATRFVSALRDHFYEKTHFRRTKKDGIEETEMSSNQDTWALPYLDSQYLQTINEAIDDDASGFITVEEINLFTKARPLDWR